jgi:hypothetical protein
VNTEIPKTQQEAMTKLAQMVGMAAQIRSAIDLLIQYISADNLIANGFLLEATLKVANQLQCSMMDAREYVARRKQELDAELAQDNIDLVDSGIGLVDGIDPSVQH